MNINSFKRDFFINIIYPRLRYPVLAFLLVVMGVSAVVFPYCPSLPALYITAFFGGLGGGALDTGERIFVSDRFVYIRGLDPDPQTYFSV